MPLSSWGHRQPFLQISHRPGHVLHSEPRAPTGQGRTAAWSPTCPGLRGCSSSARVWVGAPAPESPAHGQPPPSPPPAALEGPLSMWCDAQALAHGVQTSAQNFPHEKKVLTGHLPALRTSFPPAAQPRAHLTGTLGPIIQHTASVTSGTPHPQGPSASGQNKAFVEDARLRHRPRVWRDMNSSSKVL